MLAIYGPEEFNYDPDDPADRAPYEQDFYYAPCARSLHDGFGD